MDEYILFIDETLKTSKNPYFCMSGVSVKRDYYENTMVKNMNELKKKYFSTSDVVFHYSEMNNKKGMFSIFKDTVLRQSFWLDYVLTLKNLDFTSFGIYFDQNQMNKLYKSKGIKTYHIAFIELLKNYLHFLKSNDSIGSICIESRSFNENADLQHIYYDFIRNGSIYFSSEDFNKHLSSIGFIIKGDNCIGLQVVDTCPSALLRKTNRTKDFYNIGDMYYKKLYCYNTDCENLLGFRNIL